MVDLYQRFLTQPEPRRERGRVVASIEIPESGLSPENRKIAELWRDIYQLQVQFPDLTDRQARRLAGHWTMLRRWVRRDRHLPADAPAALLTICLLWAGMAWWQWW